MLGHPIVKVASRSPEPAVECAHGPGWGDDNGVSVLILNWNGLLFLDDCLRSVLRAACKHVEVILVDNGSTDGSLEYVETEFALVRVIALPDNLGYGRAYNAAAEQLHSQFLVFLNNDTVVDSG